MLPTALDTSSARRLKARYDVPRLHLNRRHSPKMSLYLMYPYKLSNAKAWDAWIAPTPLIANGVDSLHHLLGAGSPAPFALISLSSHLQCPELIQGWLLILRKPSKASFTSRGASQTLMLSQLCHETPRLHTVYAQVNKTFYYRISLHLEKLKVTPTVALDRTMVGLSMAKLPIAKNAHKRTSEQESQCC